MNSKERDGLIHKLDDLDRRIEAKALEFKNRGQFSDQHESFLRQLKKRQAAIRHEIDAKLEGGMSWNLIKTEFERDFDGLYGELLRWEERLDADTLAKKGS